MLSPRGNASAAAVYIVSLTTVDIKSLLKYITAINKYHDPLGLGKGVLILIQKPGKPKGPLTSVRPIVLLTTLKRKTLSLVVLSIIAPKVDEYLSPSQSGFRRERSTADVLFGYRWLCAKAQRQRVSIEFLGIDLSRAFDTIRRDKLLDTLQTFIGESELRMIRLLLADTSLEPRLSRRLPRIRDIYRHKGTVWGQPSIYFPIGAHVNVY